MGEMLTVLEVAAILRIHRSTLYRMLQRGEIPYFRVGYDYRFDSESIERWIAWKAGGGEWNPSESKSLEKPLRSAKK
jgi:excisionase family DNA binding protein